MAYLVLYREWRPQTFQEIVGQEHINRTLQNALVSNRIGHAYLFCGPRGTGKTTTAKVLAKALNCSSRQSSEPCNTCMNCQEIAAGNSMDVIEIDAASHRGIDEIRELREKVRFSPTTGSYRVYIIDEVHMLTSEAFNALLKTLEEPPSHVVFILATTEPHKVPLTILSRCQRFDFHRIGIQALLARLKEISGSIGLEIEESALYLIARAAEGGLRDALSILDQIAAYGEKKITVEDVHRLLGTVREGILDEITAAFNANDTGKALSLINTLAEQGKDLRLFVRELLTHLRSLLLLLLSPGVNGELSPAETERLSAMATALGQEKLLRLLNILTRTEQEMKWSSQPGILLEVALAQAFCTEYAKIETELAQKVHRLEELVEKLVNASSGYVPAPAASSLSTGMDGKKKSVARTEKKEQPAAPKESASQKEEPSKEELRQTSPPGDSLVLGEIIKRWEDFLDEFKKKDMPTYMFLVRGWPQQLNNGCLVIAFEEGDISKLHLEGKADQLSTALASYFLRNWQVRLAYGERPSDMEFNHLKKELSTQETLTLFGVLEEQGSLPE